MEQSQTQSLYIVRRKRKCIVIHNGNELDWQNLEDVKAGKFTPYEVDIETANQLAKDFGGKVVKICERASRKGKYEIS